VSDRDFVLELLGHLSILTLHLSRMGEELVLWSSAEFAFCTPDDCVSTGSSMMPQKKNPDGAELMRAKAGRVFGSLMTLLAALKGLPLAYNKDMQEDKEPLFDAVDTALLSLQMAVAMWSTLTVREDRMRAAVTPDVYATDLAELLVRRGVPLRSAHATVAGLVRYAVTLGKTIDQLDDREIAEAGDSGEPHVDQALLGSLTLTHSLESKDQPGSTAPSRVSEALIEVKEWLSSVQARVSD
jgi:argininosuccinate lyase